LLKVRLIAAIEFTEGTHQLTSPGLGDRVQHALNAVVATQ
jgi:hypothetical protein